jgi:hypothetical protein
MILLVDWEVWRKLGVTIATTLKVNFVLLKKKILLLRLIIIN